MRKLLIGIFSTSILFSFNNVFGAFYSSQNPHTINLYKQFVNKEILISREDLLQKIDDVFSWQSGIRLAILIGESGAGKTVLARHYLQENNFRVKAEMNAETFESMAESFKKLAKILADTSKFQEKFSHIQSIKDRREQIKQIVKFVFSQLNSGGSWCLLFDNVDDIDVITDFIPDHEHDNYEEGKIIITTRNENLKNSNMFPDESFINVSFLSNSECELLFQKINHQNSKNVSKNPDELKNFLQHIPSMPLDICAAAYYMKNNPTISFENYLELVRNPSKHSEELHSSLLMQESNYGGSRYAILSSIFEKIIGTDPQFKDLLFFICMIDSQNIPKSYLEKFKNSELVREFIYELRRFSLITEQDETFSLHRSTQAMGLKYIFSISEEGNKRQLIESIVKIMTPYKSIMPSVYGVHSNVMNYTEAEKFLLHVRACLHKIKRIDNLKNKEKYETALSLSLFHLYARMEQSSVEFTSYEQIINQNRKYISNYDLAVSLLVSTYIAFVSDEFSIKTEKERLEQVLKICDQLSDCDNLKTLAYAFLGRLYFENGDSENGQLYLKKAEELLDKSSGEWILPTVGFVCNQYMQSYLSHYIFKSEIQKSVSFASKILKFLNADKFFYKDSDEYKKNIPFVQAIRWRLARIYNCLEMYEDASENEKEAEFLYEKQRLPIKRKALLRITQAYTFLRMNRLEDAQKMIKEVLKIKQDTLDYDQIYIALAIAAEINIRLENWKEAQENCENALEFLKNPQSNLKKFIKIVCYYDLALIEHKQKNDDSAFAFLKNFFTLTQEFCRAFLEESQYTILEENNTFGKFKNIADGFDKSREIFLKICGSDHSFLENFIPMNEK